MYEQYTDKQIVEMLKPKLTKILGDGILDVALEHSESGRNLIELIATIYRSAYIRGQLGRSFIIGEKMKRASDTVFQVGDGVKLINRKGIGKESNRYYPPIGTVGKVVELGSGYCFVQWPKGVTADDGVWACPNHCLEKVTEHWAPATRDNVKAGSKVRMIDSEMHNEGSRYFPVAGTVGIVKIISPYNCEVQWPRGTTIEDDRWWSSYEHLEVLLCE